MKKVEWFKIDKYAGHTGRKNQVITMLDMWLEKVIQETNAKLVVLDPTQKFIGRYARNERNPLCGETYSEIL